MKTLKADFKYEIGDKVKSVINHVMRFIVVQRLVIECDGGIQTLYQVRNMSEPYSNLSGIKQVHEFEIEKYKEE